VIGWARGSEPRDSEFGEFRPRGLPTRPGLRDARRVAVRSRGEAQPAWQRDYSRENRSGDIRFAAARADVREVPMNVFELRNRLVRRYASYHARLHQHRGPASVGDRGAPPWTRGLLAGPLSSYNPTFLPCGTSRAGRTGRSPSECARNPSGSDKSEAT